MLARLALVLTAEVVDLTVTEEAVGTVEEDGEDTRLLLIHFCLKHGRHIHYSGGLLVWVLVTNSGAEVTIGETFEPALSLTA